MQEVIIVGGGIIGMLHAWEARKRGLDVVHLESDLEPRSATVRNLGMIWVKGMGTAPAVAEDTFDLICGTPDFRSTNHNYEVA